MMTTRTVAVHTQAFTKRCIGKICQPDAIEVSLRFVASGVTNEVPGGVYRGVSPYSGAHVSKGIRTGLVASLLVAASAGAQSSLAAPAARLPATVVSVSAGALRYDFNKVGMAPLVTLGLEHRFGSNL